MGSTVNTRSVFQPGGGAVQGGGGVNPDPSY